MLRPRVIPCLLVHNDGLVKTVKFKDSKYVGDPINAVRIFNEKEVDELMVLDIDATVLNKEPDYGMIANLAAECRMPLCYGGGIKTVEQAKKILSLGVEKVALSSVVYDKPELVRELAQQVGKQSVVVVLDAKKKRFSNHYDLYTHNGTKKTGKKLLEMVSELERLGVGEFVVNSIDQDGTMSGYDIDLVDQIKSNITVPLTVLGGAGSLNDIAQLIKRHKIVGASAGSLFVFKGRYRAVLISYPSLGDKKQLINEGSACIET
jgi:imidazole glycerol-phosphate synthase subunit HisF